MQLYYTVWAPLADRREEAARQKEAARRLLHGALRQNGQDPDRLTPCRTPAGRPGFMELPFDFNLSHTTGMAACAVGQRVGVDCEAPRAYLPAVARRVCTGEELAGLEASPNPAEAFLCLWTLKEAFVKLDGRGLAYGLKNVTEPGIRAFFPKIKIFQTTINGTVLTAMDKSGGEIHVQKVDWLS